MSGLQIVIPTDFSSPAAEILRDDPVLSSGSLLLLDPAHPAAAWSAGVPANGYALPNIAKAEAGALVGGEIRSTLSYSGSMTDNIKGKLERTGKGGLHAIVSQATALASGDGAIVTMAPAMETYLEANKTHAFYLSFWDRLTRVNGGNTGATGAFEHGVIGANNSAFLAAMRADVWYNFGSAGTRYAANALGNRHGSAGVDAGKSTTAASLVNSSGPIWGAPTASFNAAAVGTRNGFWPSFVFYRFYLEDLTVSGRTYAQVDAIDNAEFTKQVLTAGGRYFGDTLTSPSTLP